jgi:hypothetical protein
MVTIEKKIHGLGTEKWWRFGRRISWLADHFAFQDLGIGKIGLMIVLIDNSSRRRQF